jgi:hypothetical protein
MNYLKLGFVATCPLGLGSGKKNNDEGIRKLLNSEDPKN